MRRSETIVVDLDAIGLNEQPFPANGDPVAVVSYSSFDDALGILQSSVTSVTGIAFIQGPALSGKTTLLRKFVSSLPDDQIVAIVDGESKDTTQLLEALLRSFGFAHEFGSTAERLAMLRVYALQQASADRPPFVIIRNAEKLDAGTLRMLAELAQLRVKHTSAIKLVLVSDQSLRDVIDGPALEGIARRIVTDFHMHPMTSAEALKYLHAKLRAAGSDSPEFVLPISVCNELWQASGGWPGMLDRLALLALAKAEELPVGTSVIERPAIPKGTWHGDDSRPAGGERGRPEPPTLFLTQNGKTLNRFVFDKPRLLIGRSDHNDLAIDSRFVSRHHLLLVRHGTATFLMDLNSTNGTYVNSRRVSNQLLVDDDIITVGHHRIKFCDPHAKQRAGIEQIEFADTVIMKSLEDMHLLLEQENTSIFPVPSENVPTLGG